MVTVYVMRTRVYLIHDRTVYTLQRGSSWRDVDYQDFRLMGSGHHDLRAR